LQEGCPTPLNVFQETALLKFDPSEHPSGDTYRLLIGAIIPRPIAFVSTVDANGIRNLAPFSFFTACSANPPVVCFSPMVRVGPVPAKDTLRNIQATGEFVLNVVSEEFAEKMNLTSADVAPEVDEFELSGLTPLPSDLVKPARVAESHVQMECRLHQLITVSEKPQGGHLILGEVLRFHIDEAVMNGDKIDPDRLRAIGRMGGPTYSRTRDRFDMARPK
jgi:flavin reductase (DIM6/NTAB) family NADH-FMN oxidoreductase RutF